MVQFHIKELMDNFYEFVEDDNSAQAAIENSMPPEILQRSQIDEMNEHLIKNICRDHNLQSITYLNLFNNKIRKIGGLFSLVNLKTLILSFNEIEEIENLENCKQLVKLDLHNNFIRQIKNLENNEKITFLDVTHNWISDWSQIDATRQLLPSLKELGMRCNPIATKKSYRANVFSRINYLHKLDGYSFSEKDKERVNNEVKPLDIQIVLDAVKDQSKGLFESALGTHDYNDEEEDGE